MVAGVVLGCNFGDGHFHDEQLLAAVQERCGFAPGELRVVDDRVPARPRCSASATASTMPRTGLIEQGCVGWPTWSSANRGSIRRGTLPVEVIGVGRRGRRARRLARPVIRM